LKGEIEARRTQQGEHKRKTNQLSPNASVKIEPQKLSRLVIETT
jgi:hypothetical protein